MVNRETNFNRRKVKRMKTIRDKKRARINKKKIILNVDRVEDKPMTKKETRRQKRLERIYNEIDTKTKPLGNLLKDKLTERRKNRRGGKRHKKEKVNSEMVVED